MSPDSQGENFFSNDTYHSSEDVRSLRSNRSTPEPNDTEPGSLPEFSERPSFEVQRPREQRLKGKAFFRSNGFTRRSKTAMASNGCSLSGYDKQEEPVSPEPKSGLPHNLLSLPPMPITFSDAIDLHHVLGPIDGPSECHAPIKPNHTEARKPRNLPSLSAGNRSKSFCPCPDSFGVREYVYESILADARALESPDDPQGYHTALETDVWRPDPRVKSLPATEKLIKLEMQSQPFQRSMDQIVWQPLLADEPEKEIDPASPDQQKASKVDHNLPSLSAILAPSQESLFQFSDIGSPQALQHMPSMNSIMKHSLDSLFPNPQDYPSSQQMACDPSLLLCQDLPYMSEILSQSSKHNLGFHSCQDSSRECLDSYVDPDIMMCQDLPNISMSSFGTSQERLSSVDELGPVENSALQSSRLLRQKQKNRFGSNQSRNSEQACCSPVPESGPEDTIEKAPEDISRWTPSGESQEISASLDTIEAPLTPSLRDCSWGSSSSLFTVPSICSFGDASKTSLSNLPRADSKDVIHELPEDCLSIPVVEFVQTNTIGKLEEARKSP